MSPGPSRPSLRDASEPSPDKAASRDTPLPEVSEKADHHERGEAVPRAGGDDQHPSEEGGEQGEKDLSQIEFDAGLPPDGAEGAPVDLEGPPEHGMGMPLLGKHDHHANKGYHEGVTRNGARRPFSEEVFTTRRMRGGLFDRRPPSAGSRRGGHEDGYSSTVPLIFGSLTRSLAASCGLLHP